MEGSQQYVTYKNSDRLIAISYNCNKSNKMPPNSVYFLLMQKCSHMTILHSFICDRSSKARASGTKAEGNQIIKGTTVSVG